MNLYKVAAEEIRKAVATVAICDTKSDAILMGRRRDNGRWTTPGGHLEKGEDPKAGAVREVKEETGIDISEADLIGLGHKVVTKPGGEKLDVHAYKAYIPRRSPTTMKFDPDEEVLKWHWIGPRLSLPKHVEGNLHVPMKDNVLFSRLGFEGVAKIAALFSGKKFYRAAKVYGTDLFDTAPDAAQQILNMQGPEYLKKEEKKSKGRG